MEEEEEEEEEEEAAEEEKKKEEEEQHERVLPPLRWGSTCRTSPARWLSTWRGHRSRPCSRRPSTLARASWRTGGRSKLTTGIVSVGMLAEGKVCKKTIGIAGVSSDGG
jgi:hypothetical protein